MIEILTSKQCSRTFFVISFESDTAPGEFFRLKRDKAIVKIRLCPRGWKRILWYYARLTCSHYLYNQIVSSRHHIPVESIVRIRLRSQNRTGELEKKERKINAKLKLEKKVIRNLIIILYNLCKTCTATIIINGGDLPVRADAMFVAAAAATATYI